MKHFFGAVILIFSGALLSPYISFAADAKPAVPAEETAEHGAIHTLLMYLPNRVFDVLDPFRVRVRVGPGLAVGVRATKVAAAYLGSYVSIWAGLPGPRQAPKLPLPAGMESLTGAQLSVADATTGGGISPNYSPTECGLSLHPLIIGIDFDLDPIEVLDLVTGFLTIDLRNDDL